MAIYLKNQQFLFGKRAKEQAPQFNSIYTDWYHASWLADAEFTGIDRESVESAAQVAVGHHFLKGARHD